MVYSFNNNKFPSSKEYNNVLKKIKNAVMKKDIEKTSIFSLIFHPSKILKKPEIISDNMKKYWNMNGKISDLLKTPRWSINAATVETGKRFSFSQKHIGDYELGYTEDLNYDISMAAAFSAAFPILVGMQKFSTENRKWIDNEGKEIKNIPKYIHLWDGGVYDNLGLEAIYKMDNGGEFKDNINFTVVANASSFNDKYAVGKMDIKRLLDISMSQVDALRTRSYFDFVSRNKNGIYVKIGNHASKILNMSSLDKDKKKRL